MDAIPLADLLLLGVVALGAWRGLRRGALLSSLDLLALSLVWWTALRLHQPMAEWLARIFELSPGPALFASLVSGVGLGLLAYGLLLRVLVPIVTTLAGDLPPAGPSLATLDRVGGLLAGGLAGLALSLVALALHTALPGRIGEPYLESARLVRPLAQTAGGLVSFPAVVASVPWGPVVLVPARTPAPRLTFPLDVRPQPDGPAEETLLLLLNRSRADFGLPPLRTDPDLQRLARQYAADLFRSGPPPTPDALTRPPVLAVNLLMAPSAESAHRAVLGQPTARQNVLSTVFRRVGIGVVRAGLWGRAVAEVFAD